MVRKSITPLIWLLSLVAVSCGGHSDLNNQNGNGNQNDDCAAISSCIDGDGCCPEGCTSVDDDDCEAVCGNGVIDPGETCDGDCPLDCNDGISCTDDQMSGSPSTCDVQCSHGPIVSCQDGDGCCPGGCTSVVDDDCEAVCGNGVIEPGETCDGNCPFNCNDGDPCTTDDQSGGPATCDVQCSNDPVTACQGADGCCPVGCNANDDNDCTPLCGNGVAENVEVCDGTDLRGATCESQGFGGPGRIACFGYCQVDTTCCDGYVWSTGQGSSPDPYVGYGRDFSLSLDHQVRPHVSFYDSIGRDLRYTFWDGTVWDSTTVETEGDVGQHSSLDLDDNDYPRIAYYDATLLSLKYAAWNGSSWSIEVVDSGTDVGQYASLALDRLGHPHVAYLDNSLGTLKYAHWNGSVWTIQTVDSGSVGSFCSLAVDSQDQPRIAYRAYGTQDLKFAGWDGAAWQVETVSTQVTGHHASLALDAQDVAHIAATNTASTPAYIAYFKQDGSDWLSEFVAYSGNGWCWSGLALGPDGRAFAGYVHTVDRETRFATRGSLEWFVETLDAGNSPSSEVAIKIDGQGFPHVVYGSSSGIYYTTMGCN